MSATELVTIRDFLRHAVSSFRAAGLVHGHGTSNRLLAHMTIAIELPLPTLSDP